MNQKQFLVFFSFALLLLSCSKSYSKLDAKLIYRSEINFTTSSGKKINSPFMFSVPPNYTSSESYPLVIALHGYGSSAEAFFSVWKNSCDTLGFVLLVLQGEIIAEGGIGFGWGANTEEIIRTSLSIIENEIHIDKSRIYICGFSDGGYQAHIIAGRNSLIFGGFASICSPLKKDTLNTFPLLNKNAHAYISCGELETHIKILSQQAAARLKEKGYMTKYIEYKNTEHGIPKPVSNELMSILKFLDEE